MKLTDEQKLANKQRRAKEREATKERQRIENERNQKPVAFIDIEIDWKASRTWGANPHLNAGVYFKDGSFEKFTATASGCGYDKTSTVVADLFNQFLKYRLYKIKVRKGEELPYGISLRKDHKWFNGGIGINCYEAIAKRIGGVFKRAANGKMYDAFTLKMKK